MTQRWQCNPNGSEQKPCDTDLAHRVGKHEDDTEATNQGPREPVDQRMNGPNSSSYRAAERADEEAKRSQDQECDRVHRDAYTVDPPPIISRSRLMRTARNGGKHGC